MSRAKVRISNTPLTLILESGKGRRDWGQKKLGKEAVFDRNTLEKSFLRKVPRQEI